MLVAFHKLITGDNGVYTYPASGCIDATELHYL